MNDKIITANTGYLTLFPSTTTSTTSVLMGAAAVGRAENVAAVASKTRKIRRPDIESAVYAYAHIQAVRALGKTKITPEEIARALGLSVSEVQGTISALKSKGVKALHVS